MSSTNHINLCIQSNGSEDDWKNLYEASFPLDERMSPTDVRTLLASGTMLLHKTTDGQGALLCFSLVTVLSNNVLLAYIATDQTKRSSGVGSKHMKALIDLLKKLYPAYIGLFLEIESTKEKNLSVDEDKARKRRLAFYQRLHCKRMLHKEYLLPSYAPGTPARQGELLWSEFAGPVDNDATLKAVISEIYTKAYGLSPTDPTMVKVISQFSAVPSTTAATSQASTPATSAAATPAGNPSDATAPTNNSAHSGSASTAPTTDSGVSKGASEGSASVTTDGGKSAAVTSPPVVPAVTPAPVPEPTKQPVKPAESGTKA